MWAFARKYLKSFAVYFAVGGACALIEWASFYLARRHFGLHYVPATLLGFVVATYANYLLSTRVAFQSRGRSAGLEALLVYAVSLVGLLINVMAMGALIELLALPDMMAKVLATGVAFVWNYAARQFFIFSHAPRWHRPHGAEPELAQAKLPGD